MVSNKEQCLALLEKYSVPENIVAHSKQVTNVALFLGKKLVQAGKKVDLPFLEAACLLHDIDKKLCFDDKALVHGIEGERILKKEGFPKIAEIVGEHRLEGILEQGFSSLESKLLFYSDKRVNHDKIVSLEERFDYLLERYGLVSEKWKKNILAARPKVFELEKELFGEADYLKLEALI